MLPHPFSRSGDIAMRRIIAHVLVSVLGAAVITLLPWLVEMLIDEFRATARRRAPLLRCSSAERQLAISSRFLPAGRWATPAWPRAERS